MTCLILLHEFPPSGHLQPLQGGKLARLQLLILRTPSPTWGKSGTPVPELSPELAANKTRPAKGVMCLAMSVLVCTSNRGYTYHRGNCCWILSTAATAKNCNCHPGQAQEKDCNKGGLGRTGLACSSAGSTGIAGRAQRLIANGELAGTTMHRPAK